MQSIKRRGWTVDDLHMRAAHSLIYTGRKEPGEAILKFALWKEPYFKSKKSPSFIE